LAATMGTDRPARGQRIDLEKKIAIFSRENQATSPIKQQKGD